MLSEEAEVIDFTGLYDDGWAEGTFHSKFRAAKTLRRCQIGVWLKPELNNARSNFTVSINGREALNCVLPHDMRSVLQVACAIPAGGVVTLALNCDNLVSEKGADVRPLSFLITSLRFS